jgi:hypothetical protein
MASDGIPSDVWLCYFAANVVADLRKRWRSSSVNARAKT